MKNLNLLYWLLLLLLITSCEHTGSKVERISLTPEVVTQDLETVMPGQLAQSKKYVYWTDPFNSEMGVHIIDKITGDEIKTAVPIGSGPVE